MDSVKLQLQEMSLALTQRQRQCEVENRFSEAAMILQQKQDLKAREESIEQEHEKQRQRKEKSVVESAHLGLFSQLKEKWGNLLSEFEAESERLKREMKERQDEEKQDLEAELAGPKRVKLSARLLNLKERKLQAVKQHRYSEAQTLTQEIDTLLQAFCSQVQNRLDFRAQTVLSKLTQTHSKEMRALIHKRTAALEDLKQQQEADLDFLCKKYQKNRKELEGLHKHQEIQPKAKTVVFTTPVSIARVLNSSRSGFTSPRGADHGHI